MPKATSAVMRTKAAIATRIFSSQKRQNAILHDRNDPKDPDRRRAVEAAWRRRQENQQPRRLFRQRQDVRLHQRKWVGLRLPASTATELQFSMDSVVPFQPGGIGSSREWIQIDRADAADYEKDLELFRASLEFVKAGRGR